MSSKKRKHPKNKPGSDHHDAQRTAVRQRVLEWDLEHAGRSLSQFLHDDFVIKGQLEGDLISPLLREANRRFPAAAVPLEELEAYMEWLDFAVLVHEGRERLRAWDAMDLAVQKLLEESEAKQKAGEKITPEDVASIFGDAREKLDRIRELR